MGKVWLKRLPHEMLMEMHIVTNPKSAGAAVIFARVKATESLDTTASTYRSLRESTVLI